MARRSNQQIEEDYEKIKQSAYDEKALNFKQVSKKTWLTYVQIISTLKRFPLAYDRITEQLRLNRLEKNSKSTPKTFVIDASICGIDGIREILEKCLESSKIILTSITIRELESLQKTPDLFGIDARWILTLAANNPEKFESVKIDEDLPIPDDCIVKYCTSFKEKVLLLTADKTMSLKARADNVEVQYFQHSTNYSSKKKDSNFSKEQTLWPARKIGEDLMIPAGKMQTDRQSICVRSGDKEYTDGDVALAIGDNVLIATSKGTYSTLVHFKVTSLEEVNNCRLVFSSKIGNANLPSFYKSFIRDFKRRHDA